MLQHGDRVKIDVKVLKNEDHKIFPHAFFVEYVNADEAKVLIMYIDEEIVVPASALTWEPKRKSKKS